MQLWLYSHRAGHQKTAACQHCSCILGNQLHLWSLFPLPAVAQVGPSASCSQPLALKLDSSCMDKCISHVQPCTCLVSNVAKQQKHALWMRGICRTKLQALLLHSAASERSVMQASGVASCTPCIKGISSKLPKANAISRQSGKKADLYLIMWVNASLVSVPGRLACNHVSREKSRLCEGTRLFLGSLQAWHFAVRF